jgi:hypothetical protein
MAQAARERFRSVFEHTRVFDSIADVVWGKT